MLLSLNKESQNHGFKFETLFIDKIFTNKQVRDCVVAWKEHSTNYTSIFDIPEFDFLARFYSDILEKTLPINKKEYEDSIFSLGLSLPISIKSYKKTKTGKKKIEFGSILRNLENFGFQNLLSSFSIISFEYVQDKNFKIVKNVDFYKIDKSNPILSIFRCPYINSDIELFNMSNKGIAKGKVAASIKKAKRKKLSNILDNNLNKYTTSDNSTIKILEGRLKFDSKTQRRTQCTINKIILKENFYVLNDKITTLNNYFINKKINSTTRKRNVKK